MYKEFLFSADGRSKHACDNSPDAIVTLYPSQNVLCSIVHPIKSPNAASLLGGKCRLRFVEG